MSTPRFYHPGLRSGEWELSDAEARHAGGARRLRVGDTVIIFDGLGNESEAELVTMSSRHVVVRAGPIRSVPRNAACNLSLAISLPKQARQDTLIEKCTELGVAAIRPICVERTVAEASAGRMERWRRVSIAAAKQSQQAWLPEFHEPVGITELLTSAGAFDLFLLADLQPDALPLPTLLHRPPAARKILALIGPEGGFTDSERAAALAHGARPCRLTPTILRVETAAIAMAAVVLSHG